MQIRPTSMTGMNTNSKFSMFENGDRITRKASSYTFIDTNLTGQS
jgi:hypothetical protein